jgi:hypothetical protein
MNRNDNIPNTADDQMTSAMTLRMLKSPEFMIATKSIFDLYEKIKNWILTGDCGAMIYGRTRVGKTSAINYISQKLKKEYGEEFPVLIWTLTDHVATDKTFYASIINAMDIGEIKNHSETALNLKERVINYMRVQASATPLKRVVFMIDEAWKLAAREFDWLMDLYNTLQNKYDVQMSVFLFGTKELLALKQCLISDNQNQIVERFMLNTHRFYGIQSELELGMCLMELDKCTIFNLSGNSDIKLSAFYFPNANVDGKAVLYNLTEEYWEAFQTVKRMSNIKEKDIPMMYFVGSFLKLLAHYGKCSENPVYFIGKKEIVKCIEETGYGRTSNNAGDM